MVGLQSLDLPIGVRIPASQPYRWSVVGCQWSVNKKLSDHWQPTTDHFSYELA